MEDEASDWYEVALARECRQVFIEIIAGNAAARLNDEEEDGQDYGISKLSNRSGRQAVLLSNE